MRKTGQKVGWVATAAGAEGWPNDDVVEVALAGRSNAGKSTILNALLGTRQARVSQKPGKTRLLNFYRSEDIRFVDMPGYGFAMRGAKERDSWGPMIEDYLRNRQNLAGLLLIMDAKRPWTRTEAELLEWLAREGRPVILVLNKIDKMNRKEVDQIRRDWAKINDERLIAVQFVSGKNGTGIEALARTIFEKLVRT